MQVWIQIKIFKDKICSVNKWKWYYSLMLIDNILIKLILLIYY